MLNFESKLATYTCMIKIMTKTIPKQNKDSHEI